jgi:PAS domain S-box-containing protein
MAIAAIRQDLADLKNLVKDDPDHLRVVMNSNNAAERTLQMFVELEDAYRKDDTIALVDKIKKSRKDIRFYLKMTVSTELLQLAEQSHQVEEASPEKQAKFRNTAALFTWIGVGCNVIASVILALFFSRRIISRLTILQENSLRLASKKPLLAKVSGDDEIAELDHVFHKMADLLEEARRKESAIVENAADVICSLDSRGAFVTVSPACQKLFGFSQQELIGNKIICLYDKDDVEPALAQFQKAFVGESVPPFETRVKRKDGTHVDVSWSTRWSRTEGSLFCVARDITERKRVEKMKQEVVAMVSHDLRTPLATIASFLELLETGRLGELSARGQSLLVVASRNIDRMLTLVKDLLDIEKMESGMLQLHQTEVELQSVFDHAYDAVQPAAAEKTVHLSFETTALTVFADQDRLVQVLTNLLTNAIKFSAPNGRVSVSASDKAELVEITVADEGRGIPPDMLNTVFDRFKQVEESDAKGKGGTGLGLAICKALVELHGGKIIVESEPGNGARFIFTIPKTRQFAGREPADLRFQSSEHGDINHAGQVGADVLG